MRKNKIIKSIYNQVLNRAEQTWFYNMDVVENSIVFNGNDVFERNTIFKLYSFNFNQLSHLDKPYLLANYNKIIESEYKRLINFLTYIQTGKDSRIDNTINENIAF